MTKDVKTNHERGFRGWAVRFIILILALPILMLGISVVNNQVAIARDKQNFPPPGEMVNVGDHTLHIYCLGEGSPTVILEAGASSWSTVWSLVQEEIAKTTRVCSYDRAGLGWSGPSPEPRTAKQITEELHTLLINARIDGPYVMVGHSFGGPLVRVFTGRYPDEVVGVVLVDAAHPDQLNYFPPESTEINEAQIGQFEVLGKLASLGVLRFGVKQNVPTWTLPEEVLPAYFAIMSRPEFYKTSVDEMAAFDISMDQTREAGNLGDRPLIVLAAGQNEPEIDAIPGLDGAAFKATRLMLQEDLTTLSTNSQLIIAERSTHTIQLYQPELVIDSVVQTVKTYNPEG